MHILYISVPSYCCRLHTDAGVSEREWGGGGPFLYTLYNGSVGAKLLDLVQ